MNISPFRRGDKVVGYCRYSEGTEQGLKNQSTEEQADAIRKFCNEQGLILTKIFADPFASGRSVAKRDNYLAMLSFLLHKKKPDVQGLIVWDWERYGRNFDQAQLDAARLRMAGYKLFSLQQPIADDGPFAHVLEAMYFASAQNQSDMISADVKRALQANFQKWKVVPRSCIPKGWIPVEVQMGTLSDGSPRIGYRFEPDPDLKDQIIQAVEARIAGRPISEIRHILGKSFSNNKLWTLFRKPLLYGSFTYGGMTIEDYCEPIINKEVWDKLQVVSDAIKKSPRKEGSGAWSKDRALLSGLCWCGACGERAYIMRRTAKGKLYETYYCNHKHINFRKDVLDNLVLDAAKALLRDDYYEHMMKIFLEAQKKPDYTVANAQVMADIDKIDKKLEAIAEALTEAGNSRILVLKLKDLEARRELLESRLRANSAIPERDIRKMIDGLRDRILTVLEDEKSTTDELRSALSLFISAVVTCPEGTVIIRHSLPGVGGELSGTTPAPPEKRVIFPQFERIVRVKT